jgi:hypothetical protein
VRTKIALNHKVRVICSVSFLNEDGVETDGKLPHPAGFVINTNRQIGVKLSVDESYPTSFRLMGNRQAEVVGPGAILYVD